MPAVADLGAAYGTAKAGVGIASMGIMHPTEVMKNIVPVIMAGILGIYGLIVAAILVGKITVPVPGANKYSSFAGFSHLAAGLACGLSSLAAGACARQGGPPVAAAAWRLHRQRALVASSLPSSLPLSSPPSLAPLPLRPPPPPLPAAPLPAGLAIGVVGDAGVRAVGQQPALYVGMILILIFGEALGLYGLIVALILSQKGGDPVC